MTPPRFEIERRHHLSYEEFASQYLYPLKPVIVTDVLQKWPAMTRWTPEFFKEEFGEMKFQLNEDPGQDAGYKGNEQGVEYTMARFIDRVMASTDEDPAPYFRNRVHVSDAEGGYSAIAGVFLSQLAPRTLRRKVCDRGVESWGRD